MLRYHMKIKTFRIIDRTSLAESKSFKVQYKLLKTKEKALEKDLKKTKMYMKVFKLRSELKTLEEVGKEFKISRERVRQIINGYHLDLKKQRLKKKLNKTT